MDLKHLIEEYLGSAKAMQLATSHGDQPWICTVYYAHDGDWNLYWTSTTERRHSKEIIVNQKAAVAIVKDPAVKRALQIEGDAYELSGEQLIKAHEIYGAKYGDKPERLAEAQSPDSDRAFYMLKPRVVVLFDEVNFPEEPRREYSL